MNIWPLVTFRGSSSTILGYKVYSDDCPKWLDELFHRVLRPANDWLWAVRYRIQPKHQYHIVRTDLKPGYADPDTRMLHAMMTCLGEYIEAMGGIEEIEKFNAELRGSPETWTNDPSDTKTTNSQADMQAEAVAIWKWWTVERPADEKEYDELLDFCYGNGRKHFEHKPVEGTDLIELVPIPQEEEIEKAVNRLREVERKIAEDEEAYTLRLCKIRKGLWV